MMSRTHTSLLKTLVFLSLPTMLEEILATLLQYVDTAMVGQLGEQATAAVSVTTTVTWLVNSISGAVGMAVLALIARSVGAGERDRVARLSQQALFLAAACGLICGGASMALSPFIPGWMGAEEAVRGQASLYFFIVSLPMVFRSANTILGAAIRATQDTRTPMLISMGANCLNAGLNYVLIYGCELGVTGAALASAASYTLSGMLMFLAYRKKAALSWAWRDFSIDRPLLRQCARVGLPVLGTSVTSCLGYVVFAGMVSGGMGTTVFAAHSIAVTAETIFYVPGYGLRTATSALVGAALGEGDRKKLAAVSRLSIALTVGMMCLSGLALYCTARPLMALFSPVDAVVSLGAEMLRLVAFSEPFFGLMVVLEGIFYGLGRTRSAFVIETFSMWGVRILFTFLCVSVWRLDLRAVWLCMIADNVCKALLFSLVFLRARRPLV
ncbi:MATE family efflux transporter [Pseudoflavonifractor sp. 524-17]|uniref:MATE family efflux transporter n=1 Tax=Pseudoflavonifractor sp. 524-17 TaxID=2304577 RepID=UPI00137AF9F4|nr:MATE family efflux transporter [Pseudoflavonifractor sp. 524-17]NCE63146.1 MATE family efflux transporter [Pseudoflavonifractor sp. 524-17]